MTMKVHSLIKSETGLGMVEMLVIGAVISSLAVYMLGTLFEMKKNNTVLLRKSRIDNDRKLILFELANRRLPAETP